MSSVAAGLALEEGTSLWQDAWRRMRANRLAVVAAVWTFLFVLVCLAGPLLSPWAFDATDLEYGSRGPSLAHWFGTDALGRDLLVRCLLGGRMSLAIGLAAAVVSALVGTVYGAVSGYAGGRTDDLMMRSVDVLYSLPYLFLVILLMTFFGRNVILLFVALGLVQWLTTARIVRGQVLSLKEKEFIAAARAVGTGPSGILFRHLIPNALSPVIVAFTLSVPSVILQEAFLSFLGLGVQPPAASLGSLVNDGARHMDLFPWEILFPGLLLASLLLALNFLGDGLRDALDPKDR